MSELQNRLRVQRSKSGLDRALTAVDAWLAQRRAADELRQYQTQLGVLGEALITPMRRIRGALDGVAADGALSTGEVYRACAGHDRRALLVERVWAYFREKFDQRDDPRLTPTLRAADELTWSLFAQPFKSLGAAPRPAPLPYVEPYYAPRAIARVDPPADLRSGDAMLAVFLKELPIPLIGLPPSAALEPWLLANLAHEVGHHLQYDLLPKYALIEAFARILGEAAPPDDAAAWRLYNHEIFADSFAVAAIGPAALRMMAELELADEAKMLDSGDLHYPCAAVRLALLAAVSAALGADASAALAGIDPALLAQGPPILLRSKDLRERARAELAAVPAIAEAIVATPLGDAGTLADLVRWDDDDYVSGGNVTKWSASLRAGPLFPEETLRGPRRIISGAVDAWSRTRSIADDGARAASEDRLRRSTLEMLARSREAATRAGHANLESMPLASGPEPAPPPAVSPGEALFRLLDRPIEELAP